MLPIVLEEGLRAGKAAKKKAEYQHVGSSGRVYKSDHRLTAKERKQIDDYDLAVEVPKKAARAATELIPKQDPKRTPITPEMVHGTSEEVLARTQFETTGKIDSKRQAKLQAEAKEKFKQKYGFYYDDDPARAAEIAAKEFTSGVKEFVDPALKPAFEAIAHVNPFYLSAKGAGLVKPGAAGDLGSSLAAGIISSPMNFGENLKVLIHPNSSLLDRGGSVANMAVEVGAIDPADAIRAGIKAAKPFTKAGKVEAALGRVSDDAAEFADKEIGATFRPKQEPVSQVEAPIEPPTTKAAKKAQARAPKETPKAEKPPKQEIPKAEPPKGQGVTHADVDTLREEIGWKPREGATKSDADLATAAKKHSGREEQIAESVLKPGSKQTLTDDETLALGSRLRQLKQERIDAKAADDGEAFLFADNAAQKIADALDESGSRQGRNFRARQFVAQEDDAWSLQRRLDSKVKSGEIKEGSRESERIKGLIKQVEDSEAKVSGLEKQIAEMEAKSNGDVVVTQIAQGRAKIGTRSKEVIRAERDEIIKALAKISPKTSANPIFESVEGIKLVGRLAVNYIEEGVTTLAEVAAKIRSNGIDVKDHDVYRALTHKEPSTAKPNEAAKRVSELKKQADLILQINDVIGGGTPKKGTRPPAPSETVAGLRQALEDVKKITGTPTEVSQVKRLQQSIEDALDELKTGEKPIKEKSPQILDAESKKLQAQLDKIREQLNEVRATRDLEGEIADLQRQLDTGDISIPKTKEAKKLSKKLEDLKAERDLLRSEAKGRLSPPDGNPLLNIANAPKTFKSSIDISAAGRQGWLLGLANPDKVPVAFWDQLKALTSPKRALKVQSEILKRPNAALYQRGKLHLGPMDGTINSAEEAFSGRLFPGWKKFNPFRASERAYTAYLNRIRADVFDRMVKWHGGNLTNQQLELIGNYVNVATGRGGSSLPGFDKSAEFLNTALFSPRYVASRFEALAGQPLTKGLLTKEGWKGAGKARAIIARQYAQMLGALGGFYMLAKGAGAEINTDRASSDFGKIKIGDTRIDPLAGLQQAIVFGHRLATGEYTTAKGQKLDLKSDKFGAMDKGDVAFRFGRSKASPTVGAVWSLMTGEDYLGEDYDWKNAARDLTLPISMQELVEGAMEDGWDKDDYLGLLNFIGFNTSTYKEKEKKSDPRG